MWVSSLATALDSGWRRGRRPGRRVGAAAPLTDKAADQRLSGAGRELERRVPVTEMVLVPRAQHVGLM
jgi:hypothetical protein